MILSREQQQVVKAWARFVRRHATLNAHRQMREVAIIIVRSPTLIQVGYASDFFAYNALNTEWVTLPPIDRQSWGSWRNDILLQSLLTIAKREIGESMPPLSAIERHFGIRN